MAAREEEVEKDQNSDHKKITKMGDQTSLPSTERLREWTRVRQTAGQAHEHAPMPTILLTMLVGA